MTQQKALAETGRFVERFVNSGLAELGDKLGPILWQFAPFKRFDEEDFGKFLDLLPRDLDGRKLNHVVEVRHASFNTQRFIELARNSGVAIVYVDAEGWPSIADLTGDVVYARLQRGDDALAAAYPPGELDHGPAAPRLGQRVKRQTTFPCSPRRMPRRPLATCSFISSMKASCALRPRPWR